MNVDEDTQLGVRGARVCMCDHVLVCMCNDWGEGGDRQAATHQGRTCEVGSGDR